MNCHGSDRDLMLLKSFSLCAQLKTPTIQSPNLPKTRLISGCSALKPKFQTLDFRLSQYPFVLFRKPIVDVGIWTIYGCQWWHPTEEASADLRGRIIFQEVLVRWWEYHPARRGHTISSTSRDTLAPLNCVQGHVRFAPAWLIGSSRGGYCRGLSSCRSSRGQSSELGTNFRDPIWLWYVSPASFCRQCISETTLSAYKNQGEFPVDILVSMLRLGRKYQFDGIFNESMEQIRRVVPTSLEQWNGVPKVFSGSSNCGRAYRLLEILLEIGNQTLLPALYYCCSAYINTVCLFRVRGVFNRWYKQR